MAGFVLERNERAGVANLNIQDKVFPTTQITIYDENGEEVGWIQDFNATESRPVERIRHINAADAGRTLQGVPRPADATLSVTGFTIYKPDPTNDGSVISRIMQNTGNPNKLMKTLEEQKIPFLIREETVNPNGQNTVTFYHGCWLTNHSKPISINNAFVAETADIFVSFIDEE